MISVNALQFLNASSLIEIKISGKIIDRKEEHPLKQFLLITDIFLLKTISSNFEQDRNASSSIVSTESGIMIFCKLQQPQNTLLDIFFKPKGNVMEVNCVQLANSSTGNS